MRGVIGCCSALNADVMLDEEADELSVAALEKEPALTASSGSSTGMNLAKWIMVSSWALAFRLLQFCLCVMYLFVVMSLIQLSNGVYCNRECALAISTR